MSDDCLTTFTSYIDTGVISMKNKITELYAGNTEFYSKDRKIPLIDLTLDEKNRVKIGLLTVLLSENDNSIKGLLAECIKAVAEIDYPERYECMLLHLLLFSCFLLLLLFTIDGFMFGFTFHLLLMTKHFMQRIRIYVLIDTEKHEISMKRKTSIAAETTIFSLSFSDVAFLLSYDELYVIVCYLSSYEEENIRDII
jgi:hypothetical protein